MKRVNEIVSKSIGNTLTNMQTWNGVIYNIKAYGAKGDGFTDDSASIQEAIDTCSEEGGGIVYAPPGNYFIAGSNFINVKPNVILRGSGPSTRFISETGGRDGHFFFIYLKDNSAVEDFRISMSDYIRQSGQSNFIGFNKIGVGTQGAEAGKGFRVSRIGFEKCLNSHVYLHNGHSDLLVEGCYTFGVQVGKYAEVDENFKVTNWNATRDNGKLSDGSQVYCLTNFYNSGGSVPSSDVVITGGRHVNINDCFVGINSNGRRHTITNNISIKNQEGYYGGWGIDINTGDDIVATGNIMIGYTVGCRLYSSTNCVVTGNFFDTDVGVWISETTSEKNTVSGNTIRLVERNDSVANKTGVRITVGRNNNVTGNTIDGNNISGSRGIYLETSALGNNVSSNTIANTTTGIEAEDANSESNYAYANVFRSVATKFPRPILSNFFQDVRGISGTASNANNLGGSVTVTGTATSQTVVFTNVEPDANYRLIFSVRNVSGTPASGAFIPIAPTNKTTTGFTFNISDSPGAGSSITYDWFLFRA